MQNNRATLKFTAGHSNNIYNVDINLFISLLKV